MEAESESREFWQKGPVDLPSVFGRQEPIGSPCKDERTANPTPKAPHPKEVKMGQAKNIGGPSDAAALSRYRPIGRRKNKPIGDPGSQHCSVEPEVLDQGKVESQIDHQACAENEATELPFFSAEQVSRTNYGET